MKRKLYAKQTVHKHTYTHLLGFALTRNSTDQSHQTEVFLEGSTLSLSNELQMKTQGYKINRVNSTNSLPLRHYQLTKCGDRHSRQGGPFSPHNQGSSQILKRVYLNPAYFCVLLDINSPVETHDTGCHNPSKFCSSFVHTPL